MSATDTQAAAHAKAQTSAARNRERCLQAIRLSGTYGLTADECADKLGTTIQSTRPRFTELKQSGHIRDTGERRLNRSGNKTAVFVVAPPSSQQELF